jgi:hypothetical protein
MEGSKFIFFNRILDKITPHLGRGHGIEYHKVIGFGGDYINYSTRVLNYQIISSY